MNYTTALLSECNSDIELIPLSTDIVLESDTSTPPVDGSKYCHLDGKLIFLCHTRPNISYAVGLLSLFMHKPQMAHWDAIQHLLRYLNGTVNYGLLYQKRNQHIQSYTDADYLSCPNTLRSV